MKSTDSIPPATLHDLALRCNVSVSTVSKVLSGKGKFKSSTVNKVLRIAQELNYSPNAMARGIAMRKKSKFVGFFIPNIMNFFYVEMVNVVEKILSEKGYMLMLCVFADDAEKLSQYLRFLTESRASGAIICSCREDACKDDFRLAQQHMNIISIQGDVDGVDRVDITDFEGTYEIVEHLINNGHRRIGFIGYRYDISILQDRLNAYKAALSDYGIPIREEYICNGRHDLESGMEMTKSLLSLPNRPTAIHCFNEFMAQAAYEEIYRQGLSIPEDISVTGFDNISVSKMLRPRLTTVAEPIETMARIAVDMLLGRMKGSNTTPEPQQVFVKHKLIIRESVRKI